MLSNYLSPTNNYYNLHNISQVIIRLALFMIIAILSVFAFKLSFLSNYYIFWSFTFPIFVFAVPVLGSWFLIYAFIFQVPFQAYSRQYLTIGIGLVIFCIFLILSNPFLILYLSLFTNASGAYGFLIRFSSLITVFSFFYSLRKGAFFFFITCLALSTYFFIFINFWQRSKLF